mmetsp:Transcript_22927/g.54333  ORF Transcript_22927/g.54333 Transcript_22927/m.54333 type:complete len:114 (-) Transcript_22927:68-409(-)
MKTPQLQMQDKAPDSKVEIERLLRIAAARSTLDSDGGFLAEAQFRLAMILGLAATSLPHTDAAAELKQRVSGHPPISLSHFIQSTYVSFLAFYFLQGPIFEKETEAGWSVHHK